MRLTALSLAAAGLIALAGTVQAQERVKGSDLVTKDSSIETVFPKLMGKSFDQAEIDLFLANVEPIGSWAKGHTKEWNSIDEAGADALGAILDLAVWQEESVSLSGKEFFALVVKLKMVQEIDAGRMSVEQFKKEKEFLMGMMEDPNIPAESKADFEKHLSSLNQMITALENYPEKNLELYEKNKEKLDAALSDLESWGDDGGESSPPAEGNGEE